MDEKRFDHLTRMVGKGASRRSILKGLLGIGGAAVTATVVADEADARSLGTRPTVPPPTTKPPAPPTTTTPAPCPGQVQCPNSTVCCDAGTCARSGNQAICCDGTLGHGDTVCGYDCCEDPQQCCDGECCPSNAVCLARAYNSSAPGYEEHCCPADLTCDGGCCDGDCYNPVGPPLNFNGFPLSQALFDRECCPPTHSVCQGTANATCCNDVTEKCCLRGGVAICIAADACCNDVDCALGECDFCDITDPYNSECVDRTEFCNTEYGECSICMSGHCIDSEPLCGLTGCLTCDNGQCIDSHDECTEACTSCMSGTCVVDLNCCVSDGDCPDGCQACSKEPGATEGICTARCDATEPCCVFGEPQDWFCTPAGTCCPGAPNCNPEVEGSCPAGITCDLDETCCFLNGNYVCYPGDDCICNPAMTPGQAPTEANACTVSEECCEGAFCCRGVCLPTGACCSASVNPCDECEACVLAKCVPDSNQNGEPCLMGQVCCEGVCCALGEICDEPLMTSGIGIAQEPMCVPTTTTTASCLPDEAGGCWAGGAGVPGSPGADDACCSGLCIQDVCAETCNPTGGLCNNSDHCCVDDCNEVGVCQCIDPTVYSTTCDPANDLCCDGYSCQPAEAPFTFLCAPCIPDGENDCWAGGDGVPGSAGADYACCSGLCIQDVCAATCNPEGGLCNNNGHCCDDECNEVGVCGCIDPTVYTTTCDPDKDLCCDGYSCQPAEAPFTFLCAPCIPDGENDCWAGGEGVPGSAGADYACCSGLCIQDVCAETCNLTGGLCNNDGHCCVDDCNEAGICGCIDPDVYDTICDPQAPLCCDGLTCQQVGSAFQCRPEPTTTTTVCTDPNFTCQYKCGPWVDACGDEHTCNCEGFTEVPNFCTSAGWCCAGTGLGTDANCRWCGDVCAVGTTCQSDGAGGFECATTCSPQGTIDCAAPGALPCCSGYCINNTCAVGQSADGGPCNGPLHCVSGFCNATGTCGCKAFGLTCIVPGDCCSTAPNCGNGFCNTCIPPGGNCAAIYGNPGACCSGTCDGATCVAP